MGPLDLLLHLLNFLAPALALAAAMPLAARVLMPKVAASRSWIASAAIDFIAGAAVLAAGLLVFGRDGKMATYAALVAVVALVQWLLSRGARR
jgi:hypothetical protein